MFTIFNESLILNVVGEYLIDNKISEKRIGNLFRYLSSSELQEVRKILEKNNIIILSSTENIKEKKLEEKNNDIPYIGNNIEENRRKLEKYKLKLSNEELAIIYQKGIKEAMKYIYEKNLKLIYKIAHQFMRKYGNRFEFMDLVNYGYFGLLKAVERFDPSKPYRLSDNIIYWVTRSIKQNIKTFGFMIKNPEYMNIRYKEFEI